MRTQSNQSAMVCRGDKGDLHVTFIGFLQPKDSVAKWVSEKDNSEPFKCWCSLGISKKEAWSVVSHNIIWQTIGSSHGASHRTRPQQDFLK